MGLYELYMLGSTYCISNVGSTSAIEDVARITLRVRSRPLNCPGCVSVRTAILTPPAHRNQASLSLKNTFTTRLFIATHWHNLIRKRCKFATDRDKRLSPREVRLKWTTLQKIICIKWVSTWLSRLQLCYFLKTCIYLFCSNTMPMTSSKCTKLTNKQIKTSG